MQVKGVAVLLLERQGVACGAGDALLALAVAEPARGRGQEGGRDCNDWRMRRRGLAAPERFGGPLRKHKPPGHAQHLL